MATTDDFKVGQYVMVKLSGGSRFHWKRDRPDLFVASSGKAEIDENICAMAAVRIQGP